MGMVGVWMVVVVYCGCGMVVVWMVVVVYSGCGRCGGGSSGVLWVW